MERPAEVGTPLLLLVPNRSCLTCKSTLDPARSLAGGELAKNLR